MNLTENSEERDIKLSILIESPKANLKELERITSLLLETLSTLNDRTLGITKIDRRISQSFEETVTSISYKISL